MANTKADTPGIVKRVEALEKGPPAHKHSTTDLNAGTLPVARGGTGQTTLQAVRIAMGVGNTTGVLPVANGGTGNAAGKAPTAETADNALKWNGSGLTRPTAAPTAGADNDVWFQYI